MPLSVAVIISANSGDKGIEQKLAEMRESFSRHDIEPELFLAHDGQAVAISVEKALASGHSTVVAAGGDGTINAVAAKLVGSGARLGILPLGTFNHLAKDLNIPVATDEAIKILAEGNESMIDVAQVNDKIFLNNSSLGIYPKLVRYREEQREAGWTRFAATVSAIISAIKNYSYVTAHLDVNGKQVVCTTPLVFVGNNEYKIEGRNIGSRKRLDAGYLCVYVTHQPTPWGVFMLGLYALFGTLRERENFDAYVTKKVQIETPEKFLHVSIDGEIITLPTPLDYRIVPKALRVITPQSQP